MNDFFLGLDIGGTKIRALLTPDSNPENAIPENLIPAEIPTPGNLKDFLAALENLLVDLTRNKSIRGIGVAAAGVMDEKGILRKAPNLPFLDNWDLKNFFTKFCPSVEADNDSRCFVRAEAKLGAGRGYKNILGLTIGTGIGGGIIINGEIYAGIHNSAGEFGHMIINAKCQNSNVKTYEFEQLGGKEAFLKFGDRSEIIGLGVANLINSFDPEIVIMGGGGVNSGAVNLEKVKQVAADFIISPLAKNTPVVQGTLRENAQVIGAILLLKKRPLPDI